MDWLPADEGTKYGVVIDNFWAPGKSRLKLNVGDTIHILSINIDWFYGYNLRDRAEKGIVPKSYVHIKEAAVSNQGGYESVSPKETPIVQEITSVLREWGSIWKNLYIRSSRLDLQGFDLEGRRKSSNRQELSEFEMIWKTMRELIDWRRLILSSKLTMDEMKELQQKVTNKIDMGNALLNLDLVVRDDIGNILDPALTSTISLFRQHELVAQRIQEERDMMFERPGPRKTTTFNLFVNVKNFVCRIGDHADLMMSLYDTKQSQFISENYIIKWGYQGMPREIEMFNNIRVMFTDLGLQDSTREKIYLICQIIRIGRMDSKDSDTKKQTHGIRRPFGIAGIDVSDIIKGNIEPDEDKQFFVPFLPCGERDFLDTLVKKITSAKEVNHKGQGLWVSLKKLHGDIKQVQVEYPHLVSGTSIARKMGFPDVIMPVDVRNDIYVTLQQGEFKKGNKTSDKNVQVTMSVCNHKGQVIKDAICEGAGGNMMTYYHSVVYHHEGKPKWNEIIKVAVPIDDFYGSHLKFTFKHRSSSDAKDKAEKPFAMSFVKLMQDNGTTLLDTCHDLLVYKLDGKKAEDGNMYLKLPSTRQDFDQKSTPGTPVRHPQISAGSLTLNSADSFQISTLVCSTKLTHNVDLMGLLKWRDNPSGLKDHLIAFMKVDGEEVVKFLQDTLDALFNILMQNSDSDLYDNLVFDALIFLIGLISDRKYHQFRPVLEVYIKENFSATLAYNKLMVVLKFYIENVHNPQLRDSLRNALKSLEYVFKFIIRSRILFAALNEGRGKQQFELSLKQVLTCINDLMKDTSDMTLALQAEALKYLPSCISDIMTVYDPQQLSHHLIEFIDNVPPDRIVKQKLMCINDIVHSTLFMRPDCRKIILPMMLTHVQLLLEKNEDLEIAIKTLSDILHLLHKGDIGPTNEEISMVASKILRTVIQTVIGMDRKSPLIGNCVAVMTSILRQMKESHYTQYISHFANLFDLTDFLMEILMVFRDLVTANVYPSDWCEMIMLQNSVFLRALRAFSHTIKERFSNPFEQQLWNNFFHCAISFLTQGPLQLENFSPNKRAKITRRYKDMRRETGFEIRSMWYNLGQHKINFIPELVGPMLEMTLLPEVELRKATIPIFFDMMQCEFVSTPSGNRASGTPKMNFSMFENEIITQLDALVEGGRGDPDYKHLFYNIMFGLCENHQTMKKEGGQFVETIKELLQRLLEYRSIIHDENKENRMSCTVNLLNFYHDINRQEMYVRYLQKLCDLHLECDNYTEAAYTIMLYANLLKWSEEPLSSVLRNQHYPATETHRDLKEALYYKMIDYFDKGKMWEKGIEMCKELANQYDLETFDYSQLSHILRREAEFYTRIMKQMRPEAEYFRVGYYGLGFPVFLQNKVFIYRGKEYERLSDFNARLQNQFPSGKLLKTLSPPTDDIKNSSEQFLQINAVTPILEPKPKFVNKKVHGQILKYYKVNEVQKFTFSKRVDESNTDVTKMWLERTHLVTSYPLPGILRWFPVVSQRTFKVSPLENAIETLEGTNQKLKSLIEQHRGEVNLRVDPLGMVLNGVVDAAVNGGIANYKVFYDDEYLKENTSDKDRQLVERIRQVTTLQMVLLQTTLDIHRQKAPENLQPFHAHLEKRFQQMKEFVEKEYKIKAAHSPPSNLYHEMVTPTRLITGHCGLHFCDLEPYDLDLIHNGSPTQIEELTEDLRKTLIDRHISAVPKRVQTLPPQRKTSFTLDLPESGRSPSRQQGTTTPSPTKSITRMVQAQVMRSNSTTSSREARSNSTTSNRESPTKTFSKSLSLGGNSPRNSQGNILPEGREGSPRSGSVVIELSETLTTQRPRRPESNRRSRPLSGQLSLVGPSLSIASSTSSSEVLRVHHYDSSSASDGGRRRPPPRPDRPPSRQSRIEGVGCEEPPPLPEKPAYADYSNALDLDAASRPSGILRNVSQHYKDKPQPPLPPGENGEPPSVPPKRVLRLVPQPNSESTI